MEPPSAAAVPSVLGIGARVQPEDCARPDVFCAGLVTDYGPEDAGLNREAWLGLQDAQAAHLLDRADYIETVDTRDRSLNIAFLVGKGYDVIVTVGSSMSRDTQAAAARHPKQYFIGVEQPQAPDQKLANLAGLVFHEERSGFLAGALAALIDTDPAMSRPSVKPNSSIPCEGIVTAFKLAPYISSPTPGSRFPIGMAPQTGYSTTSIGA